MNALTQTRPDWTTADSELDITDMLYDVNQPAADNGYVCTAYFRHSHTYDCPFNPDDKACVVVEATLRGIAIERAPGITTYHSGHEAITILGADALRWIEADQSATLTEDYEDE